MKPKTKYSIVLRMGIILVVQSIVLLMVVNYYIREGNRAVTSVPPLYKS